MSARGVYKIRTGCDTIFLNDPDCRGGPGDDHAIERGMLQACFANLAIAIFDGAHRKPYGKPLVAAPVVN
jgi:hypothetical protein